VATTDTTSLASRLRAFVGVEASAPVTAPDAVNRAMIRHWCDAMGDANPVYTDPEAAARSVHGEIVAPPTMLQAWIMQGLGHPQRSGSNAQDDLMAVLDEAGFTSVVATNCEQEYVRYLRPGDLVTATSVIESVSDQKGTALGEGHFFTTRTTFTVQSGEVVGTMRFRMLKFRPRARPEPKPPRPRPAVNQDNAFFWEGAGRGELLIQRCGSCGRLRHPPRPMCPECRSLDWDTVASRGRGAVYSYVVPHHPPVPSFDYPYVVVLVELEEGTRLVSNLVDVEPADVAVGMPVEVCFAAVDDELTLPQFKPATG
jgi:uncharacterized OB-fold protein/acyl dehydratase